MLAYRLVAHGIGGRTVRELNEGPDANNEGMDVDEFLTWAAYFAMEPPIEQRADVHTAMRMAQTYNMNRGKGKAPKKPVDFLMRWYTPPKAAMDSGELKRVAMLQYLAMGGDPKDLER